MNKLQDMLAAHRAAHGAPARTAPRPAGIIASAATFAQAALTGTYVSDEVRAQREAICATCDKGVDDKDGRRCSVCGCGVSPRRRKIANLAAYAEELPKWGCKHPERGKGKGWPLPVLTSSPPASSSTAVGNPAPPPQSSRSGSQGPA